MMMTVVMTMRLIPATLVAAARFEIVIMFEVKQNDEGS